LHFKLVVAIGDVCLTGTRYIRLTIPAVYNGDDSTPRDNVITMTRLHGCRGYRHSHVYERGIAMRTVIDPDGLMHNLWGFLDRCKIQWKLFKCVVNV